jgi:hypothetical protein
MATNIITDCEFWAAHKNHELKVPETEDTQTPSISSGGYNTTGTGRCPKCAINVQVLVTCKICHHHEYGTHIKIKCQKCGVEGTTKNIDYIGARSLFIDCFCPVSNIIHKCQ